MDHGSQKEYGTMTLVVQRLMKTTLPGVVVVLLLLLSQYTPYALCFISHSLSARNHAFQFRNLNQQIQTIATSTNISTRLFDTSSSSSTVPNIIINNLNDNKGEGEGNEAKKLNTESSKESKIYKQTLAILTLPQTSTDRIANEAILETCMKHTTDNLFIVLRCPDDHVPKVNELRRYVGEIYSMAWDAALNVDTVVPTTAADENQNELLNVIVYPQNLPNAAPETWITHRPELECICSHSSIIGWVSSTSHGSGKFFEHVEGSGMGGLESHVDAVNGDRKARGMNELVTLEVDDWPEVCMNKVMDVDDSVIFLEDDDDEVLAQSGVDGENLEASSDVVVGHYRIPSSSLYSSVAVGGTWDGVHYGHRKLLTLAISSVVPNGGKLLIGITTDEMLKQKDFANFIPSIKERTKGLRDFVDTLAPGMKNRIKIVPIKDAYGPPGSAPESNVYEGIENDFDALVLSHETLPTGNKLNQHRSETLGLKPLKLLCTRRTEAHGMSSTALRRIRSQKMIE